jgi:hypothetical protein
VWNFHTVGAVYYLLREPGRTQMGSETINAPAAGVSGEEWRGGVVAGIAGGAVMAAVMLAMGASNVLGGAIPGLYGLAPPAAPGVGLFVHVSHGAVLGVGFAALARAVGLRTPFRTALAGLVYGVGLWVVAAALVMPVWLSAVGFPAAPPFPNFALPSLLWHAVYGVVVGVTFTVVR